MVEVADQDEVGQVGGPWSSQARMWWAMQRCAGNGAAGIHAAVPVTHGQGGALGFWWRSVARNWTASGRQWMSSVGIPTTQVSLAEQAVVCTSAREASSPDGQRTPNPVDSCSGSGQGQVTQPRRPVDGVQGAVGDFGQRVGGAAAGGAAIIGSGLVGVDVQGRREGGAGGRVEEPGEVVPPAVQAG